MVFKLVRTDTEEPSKIQLPLGTHMIGRGKFLEVDDKRVSRNHGELKIDENTVTLKALHANPCFYLKKGTTKAELLLRGSSVDLNNGDQFGLLPDTYWYQLIYCNLLDVNGVSSDLKNVDNEVIQNRMEDQTVANDNDPEVETSLQRPESPSLTQMDSPSLIERDSPSLIQRDSPSLIQRDFPSLVQRDSPTSIQRDSPSLMQREESPSLTPRAESPSLAGRPESPLISQETNSTTQNYDHNPAGPSIENQKTPSKRCHSPLDSKEGVKKVKQEPDDPQENDIAQNDVARPGPSNDERGTDSGNKQDGIPPSPAKPGPGRERCWYGASCYRRNPQHKLEFCHPGDAEWGSGARGPCPWGSRCGRRDPRHWLHHDHPPGTLPPPPQRRPGMQIVQRHGNVIYINAHSVVFNDDGVHAEDSDDSVDIDYDF